MLARTFANASVVAAMGNATDVRRTHRYVDAPQFVAVHHVPKLRCAVAATTHQQMSNTRINGHTLKNATVPQLLCVRTMLSLTYRGALHILPASACPTPLALPAPPPLAPLAPIQKYKGNLNTSTGYADFRPDVGVAVRSNKIPVTSTP
jgi:hypothetical protein